MEVNERKANSEVIRSGLSTNSTNCGREQVKGETRRIEAFDRGSVRGGDSKFEWNMSRERERERKQKV
jgi:hypothetical protein